MSNKNKHVFLPEEGPRNPPALAELVADNRAPAPVVVEDLLPDEIQAGRDARDFLSQPVFLAAVQGVKDKAMGTWMASAPNDLKGREDAYALLHAVDEVVNALKRIVTSGAMAERSPHRS